MPRQKGSKNKLEKVTEEPVKELKNKCENCGGSLNAYVVANGKMFCCDQCVEEYFAK